MVRITRWTGANFTLGGAFGIATQFATAIPDSDNLMRRGCTLVRVRGMFHIHSTVDTNSVWRGAAGLIVLTAGVAAAGVPSPAVDHDANWLWHSHMALMAKDRASASGGLFSYEEKIDNKAQRKMYDHQEIVLVVTGLIATHQTIAAFGARFLCKLP